MSGSTRSVPPPIRPGPGRRRDRAAPLALLLASIAVPASAVRAQEPVVAYQIVNASAIPASLTGRPGNAEAGRRLYFDSGLTGCSGCHGSPGGPGDVSEPGRADAPKLDGLANRLSPGEIRLWLVAPGVLSPGTAMPAFYAVGQRDDPQDPRYGEPLLTASQIEDLVAYLVEAGR